ncbi:MAG: DUF4131 domain-containing protein, partial [Stackebrandtia sp.]
MAVPDLRLALVALGVWAATLLGLYMSAGWALAVFGLAGVIVWCTRRSTRARLIVLSTVAIGLAAGAVTISAQLAVRDAEPFHGWVDGRATAAITATVADDPVRLKSSAQATYRIPVRVTRARVGDRTVGLSVRAVAFATDGEKPRWGRLLPGQRVAFSGRLARGDAGELIAAKIFVASEPPRLHGEPPWWQTAAGRLREGLRSACA